MYYICSENKGADQLHGYREADLRLCFRICKMLGFFHDAAHLSSGNDDADTDEGFGVCNCILVVLASILVVVTFPFSLFCALKVLNEGCQWPVKVVACAHHDNKFV